MYTNSLCNCVIVSAILNRNGDLLVHIVLGLMSAVLGKIIFKMISNQNQNHALKIDLKSKSKSPFCN